MRGERRLVWGARLLVGGVASMYLGTAAAMMVAGPRLLDAYGMAGDPGAPVYLWLVHGWGWGHALLGAAWLWLTRDPRHPDFAVGCLLGILAAMLGAAGVPLQPEVLPAWSPATSLLLDGMVVTAMLAGLGLHRALRRA